MLNADHIARYLKHVGMPAAQPAYLRLQKTQKGASVLLKTILNSIENHKGFVYETVSWDDEIERKTLLVQVLPRKGSKGYCSGCGKRRPTYDTMKPRSFRWRWLYQFYEV